MNAKWLAHTPQKMRESGLVTATDDMSLTVRDWVSFFFRVAVKLFFFFQAEDGIRYATVTGVQTCALPICLAPLSYWLATSLRHWTPHDRARAPYFHPHFPPSQSGLTRGVPEISMHGHQSPLSLPPTSHSLPESFPNRLNPGRPAPPELPKTTFKTQQHFGHGSVQVALSELPRRVATRLTPTFPRLGSSDQRL